MENFNLFKLKNVENAIHYFLKDTNGLFFMKDILKWDVVESKCKFKIFHLGLDLYVNLPYKSFLAVLFQKFVEFKKKKNFKVKTFIDLFYEIKKSINNKSFYIAGGSNEMLNKTKQYINKVSIKKI